ncbi:MAG: Holliday junction branch migration protein RuvA [Gammaproteobacteria bacterium]|nr:Holliday junction branch migration protein RuvA [Gammaproteobacteria bacterium]
MIGAISGQLVNKHPPFLLVDVGGVGYELEAPMTTFYALPEAGQAVSLFVHHLVREDAQLLFGFSDRPQRELFRSLLKVNGVGPRVALAILSTLSTEQFIACIHHSDVATLTRVPGIGAKTAERMILDMRDRISAPGPAGERDDPAHPAASQSPVQDAVGALIALGYKAAEATKAVRAVEAKSGERDDLIRNALQYLSRS